jgi:hypothetical protein
MIKALQSFCLFLVVLFTCNFACAQNGPTPTPVPSVSLSWVQSTGPGTITSNNVYRCTGSGCTPAAPAIKTLTTPGTAYMDNTVLANTTYVYAVTASSSAGEGGYSNAVTAVVPVAPAYPSPPDLNSPSETGNSLKAQVRWAWTR